jgi:hypothetical protein
MLIQSILFGSHAQGRARDYSDKDIAAFLDAFGKDLFSELKGF